MYTDVYVYPVNTHIRKEEREGKMGEKKTVGKGEGENGTGEEKNR